MEYTTTNYESLSSKLNVDAIRFSFYWLMSC